SRKRVSSVWSIPPEVLEPVRRQLRIANRRHDRLMAQIVLDGPSVLAVIGELVTAGMAQHVAVDQEREASSLPSPRHHALTTSNAQWCLPFGQEDVDAAHIFRHFPL